jgi:hypothetical protein
MFDAFKRLISNDEDEPTADDKAAAAAAKPKQRRSGPDRLTISGKSAVSIPAAPAEPAAPSPGSPQTLPVGVPLPPAGDKPASPAAAPKARVPFTLGLGDLLRAKPMQHFVMIADKIVLDDDYEHHDLIGRFYEVSLPALPGVDRFVSITFWGFNFQGDHTVNMRVLDIDDHVIAELEKPYKFRLERQWDTHESRTTWQVLFPSTGTYHLVVETDGRPTAVTPIFVTRSTAAR